MNRLANSTGLRKTLAIGLRSRLNKDIGNMVTELVLQWHNSTHKTVDVGGGSRQSNFASGQGEKKTIMQPHASIKVLVRSAHSQLCATAWCTPRTYCIVLPTRYLDQQLIKVAQMLMVFYSEGTG